MSYCRWSCLNGYSDVYVYADVNGGWTTHVAGMHPPPGAPERHGTELFTTALGTQARVWWAFRANIYQREQRARDAWNKANPPQPIDHPEAGKSFNHNTPLECAENLRRLQRDGFTVPEWAIDSLIAEACPMCEGRGEIIASIPAWRPVEIECPECDGLGYIE